MDIVYKPSVMGLSQVDTFGNIWGHFFLLVSKQVDVRDAAECSTMCKKVIYIHTYVSY